MKILITGAGGFVGSNLSKKLLKEGHDVYGLDNFISKDRTQIKDLLEHEKFKLIDQDVCQPLDLQVTFDRIYHLASLASPDNFETNPVDIILANIVGTRCLLELSCRTKARILFTSSSEVYGDALQHPQAETYWGNVNPNGIRSPYDEGKRAGEALVYAYKRQFHADVRVARIFNCYGPGMRLNDGRVVVSFIKSCILGEDITVHGNGLQTRCMQFVTDLVDGLIALMESSYDEGPLNIGCDQEITVLDLAKTIIEITGSKSEIKFVPPRPDDPKCRRPDQTLVKRIINYEPKVKLQDGLKITMDWVKEQLQK